MDADAWIELISLIGKDKKKKVPCNSVNNSTSCGVTRGKAGYTYDSQREILARNMGWKWLPKRGRTSCGNLKCNGRGEQAAHVAIKITHEKNIYDFVALVATCNACNPSNGVCFNFHTYLENVVPIHMFGVDCCTRKQTPLCKGGYGKCNMPIKKDGLCDSHMWRLTPCPKTCPGITSKNKQCRAPRNKTNTYGLCTSHETQTFLCHNSNPEQQ